ncbi:MAG TPA: PadR family transcriptional regulator [Opitutaceae bacterium]
MQTPKSELLQGTLDMLILKALQRDAMHGFGLSERILKMSNEVFKVEMGSLYPALCRLEARGWIKGAWGVSDSNRKARYYSLTPSGRRQLQDEAAKWATLSGAINLMLKET